MFKTISAALLAVSVLAAPAMAAGRTPAAPVIKATQVKHAAQVKHSVLDANARMVRHHVRHIRRHPIHRRIGMFKSYKFSKVVVKHVVPAIRRG